MAFLGKTYKFVSQENFDAFLKVVGVPDEKIPAILKFAPDFKLSKDGDTYIYSTVRSSGPTEVKFQSGVEFDDVIGEDKTPVKSTYTVDGNTVTQVIKSDRGSASFKREFNGDDLLLTITVDKWDGQAKRFYKAA
ncbi:hypothetical protein SFRURICE_017374 [Spodoptera frugiperda]|nr:hypothetical protein SFRURICE_017374 [Spodoptera frugiperda]